MRITDRLGQPTVDSSGCELIRNQDGELYFTIFFDSGDDKVDARPVVAHIEMSGEVWLREQGIGEYDRIFGKHIQHLMKMGWLYSKSGGTWGKKRR